MDIAVGVVSVGLVKTIKLLVRFSQPCIQAWLRLFYGEFVTMSKMSGRTFLT